MARAHSPEFDARLRALWNEGLSTAEIGRRMDVSKNTIIGRAHRLGLPSRGNPAPPKRQFSAEEDTKIRDLRRRGYSMDTIADHVGCSATAIRHRVAALGLSTASTQTAPKHTLPPLSSTPLMPAAPRPAAPRKALPLPRAEAPRPVLFARGLTCCWPIGAPRTKGFRFCDSPDVILGKSYCAEHVKAARAKPSDIPPSFKRLMGRSLERFTDEVAA